MAPPRYAPALTKPEFRAIKPKGNYQTYLNYLKRKRPGWDISRPLVFQNKPVVKPPPPPLPTYEDLLRKAYSGVETPAQMEARANRMAQTQMDYQRKLLDEEYALERENAMRQMRAFQEAGRAAAAMNAELMGRVGGAYSGAAGEISGLSGSLSAAMGGAAAADVAAANEGLARVGVPGVIVGGPAGQPGVAGEAQVGVENYRGGTLPANQMAETGVAAQFGMANLIGSQNLRATQEAQAAFVETNRTAQAQKASALKALAAGRPVTAMQFLEQLQQTQRQQIALAQGLLGAKQAAGTQTLENRLKKQQLAMQRAELAAKLNQVDPVASKAQGFVVNAQGKFIKDSQGNKIPYSVLEALSPAEQVTAAAQAAELQSKLDQIDYARSAALGWVVDTQGDFLKDAKGKKIPFSKIKALVLGSKYRGSTRGAGITPNKLVDLMADATAMVEGAYYGYGKNDSGKRVPVSQIGGFDPDDPETYGTGRQTYQQTLNKLILAGLTKTAAKSILDQYYKRGEAGAPVFSKAEITKAKKQLGLEKWNWAIKRIKQLQAQGEWDRADLIIDDILNHGGKNIAYQGRG